MTCLHPHLHTNVQALRVGEGDDAPAWAFTLSVACSCAVCGQVFKFVGSFVAPPPNVDALRVTTEPWSNAVQTEVAMLMQPAEGVTDLAWAQPAGRA